MTGGRFRMRRLVLSLPFAALACSTGTKRASGADGLEQAVEREAGKLVDQRISDCFVIGVVKHGRSYVLGFGDRPSIPNGPPDGASLFQIGSLTKLFTVAALLSLTEDGTLSLDDDLDHVLGGQIQMSPRAGSITLRQLASHTSGLPPIPESLMALPRDDADPYRQLSREVVYQYLKTSNGLRAPGRQEYSNYGMGLLGHVLEDKTGAPLEHLMAERIFEPLSMASTFMTPHDGETARLMPGVSQEGDAAAAWTFGALGGAGGLCSSVNDMLAFIQANLSPGSDAAMPVDAMQRERGPDNTRLGWMTPSLVDRVAGNDAILWHNGRVGGYASYVSIDVAQGTGVVILSAKSAELTMPGVMLSRAVREHVWRDA